MYQVLSITTASSFLSFSMDFLSLPLPQDQPQPLLDISLPTPQQPQLLDYFCDDFVCYTLQLLDDFNTENLITKVTEAIMVQCLYLYSVLM